MNQSITINFEVPIIDESGSKRSYILTVPYGAPCEEALQTISELKNFLEMRQAELQNAQPKEVDNGN